MMENSCKIAFNCFRSVRTPVCHSKKKKISGISTGLILIEDPLRIHEDNYTPIDENICGSQI